MSYEDYVCGTRFQALADVVIGQHGKQEYQEKKLIGYIGDTYPQPLVVYCHTHDFRYVVDRIAKLSDRIVLVTHNSDGGLKDSNKMPLGENDADVNLMPPNVVKWYAQNVERVSHSKVVPIPIGLENRYCFPYDKAQYLFEKDINTPITGFGYLNCNLRTNYAERSDALNHCQLVNDKVTVRLGQNGEDYNSYLEDILKHKAVISPRGNGLDCHRTWETLYLQRIPIMKYDAGLASMNLPIVWLDEWSRLHTDYEEVENMVDSFLFDFMRGKSDTQALSMNYWAARIRNAR